MFDLNFDDSFFYAEGEPDDAPEFCLNSQGKPVSVYSAVCLLADTFDWEEMARDVFECDDPDHLTIGAVMDRIRETNTCSSLSSPVEVWIDEAGDYTVKVYSE